MITKVSKLLSELNVLPGAHNDSYKILVDADLNARRLFNIYIRHQLCSKNVIMNERMSSPSFEWLLGEIKSKFDFSIVHAGEMVGSVAAIHDRENGLSDRRKNSKKPWTHHLEPKNMRAGYAYV